MVNTMLQTHPSKLLRRPRERGFTLLELLVVITIVGILAAMAIPNLIQTPQRARESVLKTNLRTLRQTIDQYFGDKGTYPPTLEALAEDGYLRDVPFDPMTETDEWGLVYDQDLGEEGVDPVATDHIAGAGGPGIIDVYSLSDGTSIDGEELYAEW